MNDHDFGPIRTSHSLEVYGADLGLQGVTDVSASLRFMDRGRVESIESLCRGVGQQSWLSVFMVNVYRLDASMHGGARVGEHLEVITGLHQRSSHRAAFDHRIINRTTGDLVGDATVEVTFIDRAGQLAPVPEDLEALLSTMEPTPLVPSTLKFTPKRAKAPFPFSRRYRIYYEDTDAQAIAYHVTYIRFCERALQDLIEEVCPEPPLWRWLESHRLRVTQLSTRYIRSARIGDVIEVRVGLREIIGEEALFEFRLFSVTKDQEQHTTNLFLSISFTNEAGENAPLPEGIGKLVG